ncbi:MAG TPA: SBBP repeat-containing protein [Bryobacteraceae bacterium]|nr:SBBP repeat-containing protein [Bryobacteraceae bacterium]
MRIPVLALLFVVRSFALPLSFEERDPRHFLARLDNGFVELTPDRVVIRDVTLRFVGADHAARLEGAGRAAPSTYISARSRRSFQQFPRLAIRGLYPGVDAVFYGNGGNLEYDLQVGPHVSLDQVRISLEGGRGLWIDEQGNLTIETAGGAMRQSRPRVFQGKREISARYVLLGGNLAGIELGEHDARLPLTIDPVLAYVKTFGGSVSNAANAITTDVQGNIYVAGQSSSPDFPTTAGSLQPRLTPSLRVLSNAGTSNRGLNVGPGGNVGVVSGTADGKILYAATSKGIFLSGDSGATWKQTAPLPAVNAAYQSGVATVYAISLDSFDPATILVATNLGLFGSDSGGEFWGPRDTGIPVSGSGSVWASNVFYDPVNPLIAYATTSNPAYFLASADAGNTWRILNPTYPGEPPAPTDPYPPIAATITPDGGTLYVVNGNGTLLKSTDGGASWVKLAQGLNDSTVIQLDPSNPTTIYVFDQQGLQKSTDGGLTFSAVTTPANPRGFGVDASGALYVTAINSILYVSTDGGNTFAPVPHVTSFDVPMLSSFAGNVYAGTSTTAVPFVVKLDPTGQNILYSTFLGGSAIDGITGIAVDSQGEAVVVGYASSPDFPLTIPTTNPPEPNKTDGFIAKLSADGTHLIFSTALGASKLAGAQAVALDPAGAIYVTGSAYSADFPTTPNAVQPAYPTRPCTRVPFNPLSPLNLAGNTFVSKYSADGSSLLYSTFLTGSCGSQGSAIAVDAAGDAIVVGNTTSPDFPVTAGTYQPAFPGPLNQATPTSIANAGFVTKLSPGGDKIVASSYIGGGFATSANGVALDAAGNAYITGFTQGITPGATPGVVQSSIVDRCTPTFFIGPSLPYTGTGDAFVLKLDPALATAKFLTYLGGGCQDAGTNIAIDSAGNLWVTGSAQSSDFPLLSPFQGNGSVPNSSIGFVTEFNNDASKILFSSFGAVGGLALGPSAVYLAGTTNNLASVTKIDPTATPSVEIDTIVPLGFQPAVLPQIPSSLAPGMLVQINGRNLGPAAKVTAQLDATGRLPFELGNTIVFFDNIPAPIMSVQASTIVCFVPFEIASATTVTVSANGQKSNAVRMGVTVSSPMILSVVNQDGSVNSADHPAKGGSVITLYVSGLGETTPESADGLVNSAPLPVPVAPSPVQVTVNGVGSSIQVLSVTAAPQMIAGISQVNLVLPRLGDNATGGKVTITLNGGFSTAPVYVTP